MSFSNSTILVGPNNEGKSNILRALVLAMDLLALERRLPNPGIRRNGRHPLFRRSYDWDKDYPIHLKEKHPDGKSVVDLEFTLTAEDASEFRETIKNKLTGTLPVKFTIGKNGYEISVNKQGLHSDALKRKTDKIASFIAQKIELQHIPAVRTAKHATESVGNMIERAFYSLDKDPEYTAALNKIAELQRPLLDELSRDVKSTLVKFMPKVTDVRFDIPVDSRSFAFRRGCEITIDDGTPTLLQSKGDGIQSLVALGLARHVVERTSTALDRNLILAIEEPESHLHPNAIHELRAVISELSETHQVVLTTHNPLFVDRVDVKSNIIVKDRKARPAKNISEVRDVLGVRAADNLRNADLVVVVEGDEDKISLTSILRHRSKVITKAMDNNTVVIESMHGSGNLTYKLSLLRESLCLYCAVLDNDIAGQEAFNKALQEGLIDDKDTTFTTVLGRNESEFEDMINVGLYEDYIKNKYRVSLANPKFRGKKKWSVRMKESFTLQGKRWTELVERDVKRNVANLIAESPADSVNPIAADVINTIVTNVEMQLEEIRQSRT